MIKKTLLAIIIVVFFVSVFYVNGDGETINSKKSVNYYSFLNLFNPGSPQYSYHIFYKPGGYVHAQPGKTANITFYIEKINISTRSDFYLRFIITKGFWCPYKTPSPSSLDLVNELKKYNSWLNNTVPLTYNTYSLSPEKVHFKENMRSLSINIRFKIYGVGKDWGITVMVKPANGSLWIPISGIPVNVAGEKYIVYPWLYTGGIITVFIACSILLKKRRFLPC